MRCTVTGEPYTVFGYGGKQVRDNIHSADLVRAFAAFHARPRAARGLQPRRRPRVATARCSRRSRCASEIAGRKLDWTLSDEARIGDHRWWISDLAAFQRDYPDWRLDATTSRRSCGRSTTRTSSAGRVSRRVKLSVVIPAHNEAGSIAETVARHRGGARARSRSTTRSSSSTTRARTDDRESSRASRQQPASPLPSAHTTRPASALRFAPGSTPSKATRSRSSWPTAPTTRTTSSRYHRLLEEGYDCASARASFAARVRTTRGSS